NDAGKGGMFANDMGGRRRGEESLASEQHTADAIRRGHPQHRLDDLSVVIAAITTEDERSAPVIPQDVENGLEEVFDIVRLLELSHLLAQAGSAGPLTRDRLG